MSLMPFKIIDEYNNIHYVKEILGEGGQGIVYRTEDLDIAIKLATKEGLLITERQEIEKNQKKLKLLRLLPLPEGIHITMPVAVLKDTVGYVMRLLGGMVSIGNLWPDNKRTLTNETNVPEWLSEIPTDEAKKIMHYANTGGLRRRLELLQKCANIIARLHANGLVYGDISPNNIFISDNILFSEVWLIDADNIAFDSINPNRIVFTEKYGAPELLQGNAGVTSASDSYAFSVLAFYVLSLIHPFVGRKVYGTFIENDWANEKTEVGSFEDDAYSGRLPWVDNKIDTSNSSDSGLPRELLLTDELKELFRKTFEEGKNCSFLRPQMQYWSEALAKALDLTILCDGCKMSWPSSIDNDRCPYCETPTSILKMDAFRWNGKEIAGDICWKFTRELSPSKNILIPARLFTEYSNTRNQEPYIEIEVNNHQLIIKKTDLCQIEIFFAAPLIENGIFKKLYSQQKLHENTLKEGFWLYSAGNIPRLIRCFIDGVME